MDLVSSDDDTEDDGEVTSKAKGKAAVRLGGWSCSACTFHNASTDAHACELCSVTRTESNRWKALGSQADPIEFGKEEDESNGEEHVAEGEGRGYV